MTDLLELVLEAHGGLRRWRALNTVRATFLSSGGLLPMKGMEAPPRASEGIASTREQRLLIEGYREPSWRMNFAPQRVAIETSDGKLIEERKDPRSAFSGHTLWTPWDLMHVAYFNGYARWTYLTTPFFMTLPGFEVTEIEPRLEGEESWRGLNVRFPDGSAGHSAEQQFYFGPDFLLRRHDYRFDIGGGVPVAQYVHDLVQADKFWFPTKRRAYVRTPKGNPIHDLLLISIDISDYHVEER